MPEQINENEKKNVESMNTKQFERNSEGLRLFEKKVGHVDVLPNTRYYVTSSGDIISINLADKSYAEYVVYRKDKKAKKIVEKVNNIKKRAEARLQKLLVKEKKLAEKLVKKAQKIEENKRKIAEKESKLAVRKIKIETMRAMKSAENLNKLAERRKNLELKQAKIQEKIKQLSKL